MSHGIGNILANLTTCIILREIFIMEKLNFSVSEVGDNGLVINTQKPPTFFSDLKYSLYTRDKIELDSDILITAAIEKNDKQFYLSGHLELKIKSPCSRCLTMVSTNISPDFNFILLPENSEDDELVCDDDIVVESYKGNIIDITDYLYEVLSISVPVKVLCNSDCKGICAYCGSNLNNKLCGCKSDGNLIRNSFAILKNYKI